MVYRGTPLENGYSPAELLIGCKLHTTIPAISEQLKPRLPDYSRLREKEESMRARQKKTILTSIIGLKPWNPFCQGKLCGYLIVPPVEKLSNRLLLVHLSFRPQKVYIGGTAETPFRCLCQIQRTSVKLVANQLLILTLPRLAVVVCQSHLIDLTQAD